jgi:hypothetical protein
MDLELKPLEVLVYLLQLAGDGVSKNELLDAGWPGLNFVEGSFFTAVYVTQGAGATRIPVLSSRWRGLDTGDRARRAGPPVIAAVTGEPAAVRTYADRRSTSGVGAEKGRGIGDIAQTAMVKAKGYYAPAPPCFRT